MADEEQFVPEVGDEESFNDWEHPEPGPLDSEGWLDPDVGVPPVVDDLRPGETLEQRDSRLLQRNADEREEDRPEGTEYNPRPDRILDLVKPAEPVIRGSAVKVIDSYGVETWRDLRTDEQATQTFFEVRAEERGLTLADLRRRFPPGRPKPKDRYRRQVVAEIVEEAFGAGAKTSTIEKVLGLDRRRISELRNPDKIGP
jgi:hypothetical protein